MFSLRRFVLVIMGILLVLLAVLPLVSAQDTTANWTPPEFLGKGWWQSMALDLQGNVHVGWYGSISDQEMDVMDYRQRHFDGTWTPQVDIFCPCVTGFTVRSALATSPDGMLYALFRNNSLHQFSKVHVDAATSAANWSTPMDINKSAYYIDVAVDAAGTIHVVYAENVSEVGVSFVESGECQYCTDVQYRQSKDQGRTWSEPKDLSNNTTESTKVNIQIGQNGRLYVFWDENTNSDAGGGRSQDVEVAYSDDGGATWSKPIILDGGGALDKRPAELAFAELRNGSWMAVWRYSGLVDWNIYFQTSSDQGRTWSIPQAIPGFTARSFDDSKFDDYEMVVDKVGNVHFFGAGQRNKEVLNDVALYHAVYAEGIWTKVERIYYNPAKEPEWPQAIIGAQNDIHLTWFVRLGVQRDQKHWLDQFEVYYSYQAGTLNSEPTQAFLPTQTPPPTPTVVQFLEPTTTPLPTLAAGLGEVSMLTKDGFATQTLVTGIIVTALFCAVVAVGLRMTGKL